MHRRSSSIHRAGFTLSKALFRKKCGAPHLGRHTHFFPFWKNWRPTYFRLFLVISVCQLSVLHPSYIFSRKTGDLFWSSLSLSLDHSGVAHCFRHVAKLQKIAAPLVGPLFVGAPVRPNTLNMPKSAAEHT